MGRMGSDIWEKWVEWKKKHLGREWDLLPLAVRDREQRQRAEHVAIRPAEAARKLLLELGNGRPLAGAAEALGDGGWGEAGDGRGGG